MKKRKKPNTLQRNIHATHSIMQKGGPHGRSQKAERRAEKVNLYKDLSKTDD